MVRKRFWVGGFETEQIAVCAGGAPELQFFFVALAEAERNSQRGFALDPPDDFFDPIGDESIVFTGLQ